MRQGYLIDMFNRLTNPRALCAAPVALSAQSLEGSRGRCSGAQEEDQATNGLQQDSGSTSIYINCDK